MKLSEMTTDQSCDAMIRLTTPIQNITGDERLEPMLQKMAAQEGKTGMSVLQMISDLLPTAVPMLLKDHREDLYEIISILSGERKAEIGKKKLKETIAILKDSIDEDLIGFFKSSGR